MSLLPNQSEVAPGISFFAPASGGGGGGGGGPNPSVSSLTIAPGTYGGVFPANGVPGTFNFSGKTAILDGPTSLGLAIWSPANGNGAMAIQTPGADGGVAIGSDGSAAYINTINRVLPLNMTVNAGVSISSLTVSSINGATPGGGGSVPTNLSISTLTVNDQPTAAGATFTVNASDTNLYSLSVPGQAAINLGVVGGRKQMYAPIAQSDDFMVSTITSPGGKGVNMIDPLLVSSIVGVSTINGAAYPPASSGPTRTTINTTNGAVVLGNNTQSGSATSISDPITTVAGHLYSLNGFMYAIPSPNCSSNAALELELGNIDRTYQAAIPLSGYAVGNFGNSIPVNMLWRSASSGTNNLYAKMYDPLNTAVSTFLNASAALNFVDWGPIA